MFLSLITILFILYYVHEINNKAFYFIEHVDKNLPLNFTLEVNNFFLYLNNVLAQALCLKHKKILTCNWYNV